MINNWFRPSGKSYTEFINNFLRCNIKSMKKNLDDILKNAFQALIQWNHFFMESFYGCWLILWTVIKFYRTIIVGKGGLMS